METEFIIPITIILGLFSALVGIRYLSNKEKMTMIEKGLNPNEKGTPDSLKFPAACIGLGAGLLLAFITTEYLLQTFNKQAIYFSFVLLCTGIAIILAHNIDDKRRK